MLPRFARFLAICTWLVALSAVPAADLPEADGWTVAGASGPVHGRAAYAPSHQWARVRAGDRLAPLTAIRTGSRGETTLTADGRTLTVGPDAELELPALDASDRSAEALHDRGTVDYDISATSVPGLDVVTPYLVAATDAATFRVTILSGTSVVDVFEGTVVVTSRLDGSSAVLGAGEGATVDVETATGLDVRAVGGDAVAHKR